PWPGGRRDGADGAAGGAAAHGGYPRASPLAGTVPQGWPTDRLRPPARPQYGFLSAGADFAGPAEPTADAAAPRRIGRCRRCGGRTMSAVTERAPDAQEPQVVPPMLDGQAMTRRFGGLVAVN